MANRYFNDINYTLHKAPVNLDLQLLIGASGAVTSFQGLGITSVTKAATGVYQVTFDDQYTNCFAVCLLQSYGNVTGVSVSMGALVTGTTYIITALGNSTQAQWVAAGLPSNTIAAVGVGFTATAAGAGTGTVKAYSPTTIVMVEPVGDPTKMIIGNPGANGRNGGVGSTIFIATLNTSNAVANAASGSTIGIEFMLGLSSAGVNGVIG